jgi:hypothetical protein
MISQKSEDLIYIKAEAWNSSHFFGDKLMDVTSKQCDQQKK